MGPQLAQTSYENCTHDYLKKAGYGRYGQRKVCMNCGRSFDDPSPRRIGKRRVKPVTAKEMKLIVEMYRMGKHVDQITEATGLSRVTVFRWIRKANAVVDLKPKLLFVVTF